MVTSAGTLVKFRGGAISECSLSAVPTMGSRQTRWIQTRVCFARVQHRETNVL